MSGDLRELAERIAHWASGTGRRIVTAESCTGGWIAKVFTDLAGSSRWFECGFVTYSDAAKSRDLGVSPRTLEQHGAVSEATVREMAAGALRTSRADVSIAVSGIAGPDGGSAEKPVGTVWLCTAHRRSHGEPEMICEGRLFGGDRDAVRRSAVENAMGLLLRWDASDPK